MQRSGQPHAKSAALGMHLSAHLQSKVDARQTRMEKPHWPQAETIRDTSSGPKPLPKSSSTVCSASATPLTSGSFTFSNVALHRATNADEPPPDRAEADSGKLHGLQLPMGFHKCHCKQSYLAFGPGGLASMPPRKPAAKDTDSGM